MAPDFNVIEHVMARVPGICKTWPFCVGKKEPSIEEPDREDPSNIENNSICDGQVLFLEPAIHFVYGATADCRCPYRH